ncbi:MAG: exopolysaccharide biosynthesis protein [Acidimicrobiales bacterium]|nr:exopolysaccharide biosynthesis protein [Hyphomonadaceae bacterium]RZV37448.1 MAG: exopolysaccharide biosynthesis protein [Acidimicrobiales bacterium]
MIKEEKPLESLLDTVDEAVEIAPDNKPSLRQIIVSFGNKAFGPVLVLSGLMLMTPIAALPGMPAVLSTLILVFSAQLIMGWSHPWLPAFLTKIKLKQKDIEKTDKAVRPVLKKLDGLIRPRVFWANSENFRLATAILSILIAIAIIPLGVLPFGVALPGLIIFTLGLGIMARDGLFILAGYSLSFIFAATIATALFIF